MKKARMNEIQSQKAYMCQRKEYRRENKRKEKEERETVERLATAARNGASSSAVLYFYLLNTLYPYGMAAEDGDGMEWCGKKGTENIVETAFHLSHSYLI